ncbi:hypothetical protein DES39_0531 [Orbus hercynius]|uniref:HTH domain-containing protein n=1 Tax=Orbus hercynius TaxID=593135 RepID=A0A495RIR9_9GAMM|nr:hypothetical protein [Orbus hercynius]RKS87311.1 hypothetical protein DES39_0531 [Orbus hercynius]
MLVNEYVEVKAMSTKQIANLINLVEKERKQAEETKREQLVDEAKRMLKAWGAVNSYSSRCGYKNISSMFSALYPRCDKIVIENEIEFVEVSLLSLKNSNDKKKQEQYKVAELYYKGFDVVDYGCDWSERLTACDIATELSISRRTVFNRLNELHSFIVSNISNFNII